MSATPVSIAAPIGPEDRLRADFYALFARLLLAPPDAALLRMIGTAPLLDTEADGAGFAIAWARLAAAARVMDPGAAAEEFEALFGGVGHSAVSLFGSRYAGETARGSLLVDLRAALAGLGLGRQPGQSLPEDHLAAVFETMRLLIAGGPGISPRDIVTQRDFFRSFVASWIGRCCAAITENPVANLYRLVAECVSLFTAIEDENYAIA